MNERIKKIRKEQNMTLEEFGKKIGITKSSVSLLESGRNNPSDQTIKLICSEFNVSEEWIRDGTGEMFEQLTDQEKLMKYTALLLKGKDSAVVSAIQTLIITYEQLDTDSKATLEKIALQYISNLKKSQ